MNSNIKELSTQLDGSGGNLLQFTDNDVNNLYPSAIDWRKLYFWTPQQPATRLRYTVKLSQSGTYGIPSPYRLPLIRLPELVLISAEAALDSDPAKSIARLNDLYAHRGGIDALPGNLPTETIREYIKQEYRREFVAEGVLFHYYKRLDDPRPQGAAATFNRKNYVAPIPAQEMEFGNRK
jgi:hypothetical protein